MAYTLDSARKELREAIGHLERAQEYTRDATDSNRFGWWQTWLRTVIRKVAKIAENMLTENQEA